MAQDVSAVRALLSLRPKQERQERRAELLTLGLNLFVAETTKFQLNLNWEDDEGKKVQKEILAQAQFGF